MEPETVTDIVDDFRDLKKDLTDSIIDEIKSFSENNSEAEILD